MIPHIHTVAKKSHKNLLDQNRKDPITGEVIKEGDEIVFCAGCKSAFLKESWEYLGSTHCDQKKTLAQVPGSFVYIPKPVVEPKTVLVEKSNPAYKYAFFTAIAFLLAFLVYSMIQNQRDPEIVYIEKEPEVVRGSTNETKPIGDISTLEKIEQRKYSQFVIARNLNLRSGPGTNYPMVNDSQGKNLMFKFGTMVHILEEKGRWAKVSMGSERYYVSSDYLVSQEDFDKYTRLFQNQSARQKASELGQSAIFVSLYAYMKSNGMTDSYGNPTWEVKNWNSSSTSNLVSEDFTGDGIADMAAIIRPKSSSYANGRAIALKLSNGMLSNYAVLRSKSVNNTSSISLKRNRLSIPFGVYLKEAGVRTAFYPR